MPDSPTPIETFEFQLEGSEYDDELHPGAYPYEATVFATVHLRLDGNELTHDNYLPARVDLVDTARAHFEILAALDRQGIFEGEPFCCTCGTRGCAYITWSIEPAQVDLVVSMQDLGGRTVGDGTYRIPYDTYRTAVDELISGVLGVFGDRGVDTLPWRERKDPPVAGREHWASRAEFLAYRERLQAFDPPG